MNNTTAMQALPIPRKSKKKQGKTEVDRMKQAEKKKRRLEKALATSAAIRAELEKKKLMKKEGRIELVQYEEEAAKRQQEQKDEMNRIRQVIATSAAIRAELEMKKKQKRLEEQQRLDREGAAVAEAVALHVLLGEEDSNDDSHGIMLNREKGFSPWDYAANIAQFMGTKADSFPHQACGNFASFQGLSNSGNNWSLPYDHISHQPYYDEGNMGLSAELIAAEAISSLHISESPEETKSTAKWFGWYNNDNTCQVLKPACV